MGAFLSSSEVDEEEITERKIREMKNEKLLTKLGQRNIIYSTRLESTCDFEECGLQCVKFDESGLVVDPTCRNFLLSDTFTYNTEICDAELIKCMKNISSILGSYAYSYLTANHLVIMHNDYRSGNKTFFDHFVTEGDAWKSMIPRDNVSNFMEWINNPFPLQKPTNIRDIKNRLL